VRSTEEDLRPLAFGIDTAWKTVRELTTNMDMSAQLESVKK